MACTCSVRNPGVGCTGRLDQAISVIESLNSSGVSHKSGRPTRIGVGSFAAKNGAGTKGEMGERSEWIAASEGSDGLGSCQAHHVGGGPEEDRGSTAGKVGEGEGGAEEGGLVRATGANHSHRSR
jgi:hypothetical protein